jgi:hypothetical protein
VILLANRGRDLGTLAMDVLARADAAWAVKPRVDVPAPLEAVAARLERAFASDPAPALEGLIHPDFLAQVPMSRFVDMFESIFATHGACVGHSFVPSTRPDWPHACEFRTADGRSLTCYLTVDGSSPARITGLYFPPSR